MAPTGWQKLNYICEADTQLIVPVKSINDLEELCFTWSHWRNSHTKEKYIEIQLFRARQTRLLANSMGRESILWPEVHSLSLTEGNWQITKST